MAEQSAHIADSEDQAGSTLGVMERHEFVMAVRRAEVEAVEAAEVRDGMLLWAKRLLPYLNRDPQMTIATALQHYRAAQATAAPTFAGDAEPSDVAIDGGGTIA